MVGWLASVSLPLTQTLSCVNFKVGADDSAGEFGRSQSEFAICGHRDSVTKANKRLPSKAESHDMIEMELKMIFCFVFLRFCCCCVVNASSLVEHKITGYTIFTLEFYQN